MCVLKMKRSKPAGMFERPLIDCGVPFVCMCYWCDMTDQ